MKKLPSPLPFITVLVALFVVAYAHPPAFLSASPSPAAADFTTTPGQSGAFVPFATQTLAYAVSGAVGDRLTLTIDDHPTTGFLWEVAALPSQLSLVEQEHLVLPTEKTRMGAPGKLRFSFTAIREGQGVLVLVFRRPWETDKTPERILVALVAVR